MYFYYQNVRGLKTKIRALHPASYSFHHDVLFLSETWLDSAVLSSEVLCNDYQVYRKDRSMKTSSKQRGGGVLIALKSHYVSSEVSLKFDNVEMVCVKLALNSCNVFMFCVYIPPQSPEEVYENCVKNIEFVASQLCSSDQLIVCGDFNLPNVEWSESQDDDLCCYLSSTNDESTSEFLDKIASLPLFQINGVSNNLERILDLILLDSPNDYVLRRSETPLVSEDLYHPSIEFSTEFFTANQCIDKPQLNFEFDFKRADYSALNRKLSNIDWSSELKDLSTNSAVIKFYSMLYDFMEECIPKRRTKNKSSAYEPWITPELKRLKNRKNHIHKRLKANFTSENHLEFSNLRRELALKSKIAYEEYLSNVRENLKTDPNCFWEFIKHKRKIVSHPVFLEFEGHKSTCDKDICDIFAIFLGSVYDDSQISTNVNCDTNFGTSVIFTPFLNVFDVQKAACNVKESFSAGPDNIPSCIIRNCATSLSTPLCYLFNLSLSESTFPELWKSSFLIPLFKSGNRTHASNYRGIAKLSGIPKLFESLLTNDLFHHIKLKLTPSQHGFFKGRSITSNLMELTSTISSGFADNLQTDVGYFDFSKAFDRINHLIMVKKLKMIGFDQRYVNWFYSYLSGRTQNVKFKEHTSQTIHVPSGVPQGSHLGPLLFLIYINDLPDALDFCEILLYADDAKVFYCYSDENDSFKIQHDFDKLCQWSELNGLSLNTKKCKVMTFSRKREFYIANYKLNGQELERCESFNDLGVRFDPKLTFISHIDNVISKASSRLGMIKRWAKELNDPYVTKSLYVGLVRSILEFACQVWNPFYAVHVNRIESVQKQFLLFALRELNWENRLHLPQYKHRLLLIDMNTLEDRRKVLSSLFVFNVLVFKIDSAFLLNLTKLNVPYKNLRNFVLLKKTFKAKNYLNNEPFSQCIQHFNCLYEFIDFQFPIHVIKNKILTSFKRNL